MNTDKGKMRSQIEQMTVQVNDLSTRNDQAEKNNLELTKNYDKMKKKLGDTINNNNTNRETAATELMNGINKVALEEMKERQQCQICFEPFNNTDRVPAKGAC